MANALKEDLTDRYVVLTEASMAAAYRDIGNRVFKVTGGFGAVPYTSGGALLGYSPIDGEKWRAEGRNVERFATDEEIALVSTDETKEG